MTGAQKVSLVNIIAVIYAFRATGIVEGGIVEGLNPYRKSIGFGLKGKSDPD